MYRFEHRILVPARSINLYSYKPEKALNKNNLFKDNSTEPRSEVLYQDQCQKYVTKAKVKAMAEAN